MNQKWKGLATAMSHIGLGTKGECAKIIRRGKVKLNGAPITNPTLEIDTFSEQIFEVDNEVIPYEKELYLVLNKPSKYECSHRPSELYTSVFNIFPKRYFQRKEPLLCCGRLDADTTGLLLFSTSGQFVHLFQSKEISKMYSVTVRHVFTDKMISALKDDILLNDGKFVKCQSIEQTGEKSVNIEIIEGHYHQVKRMIASVGNRLEKLSRIKIGSFEGSEIKEGEWRKLTRDELRSHFGWTQTYAEEYEKSIRPPILPEMK